MSYFCHLNSIIYGLIDSSMKILLIEIVRQISLHSIYFTPYLDSIHKYQLKDIDDILY